MIRPAMPGDAALLGRLHIETWQIAYEGLFAGDFLEGLDVPARISWFERNIRNGRNVLVAEEGTDLVGFCFIGESAETGWGEVYAIYVHPDFWGDGYGRRLLEAAEHELSQLGFTRALLWVLEPNGRARTFYERQGWTLGKPIRIEEIGGAQVNEVRYERELRDAI